MKIETFAGSQELVDRLDQATQAETVEETTRGVQSCLEELISSGKIRLTEVLRKPDASHYARHLLYRSEERGYTVIAMVWSPGQGTPLHDHDGTWCVEGVLEGEILVTQYEALEHDGDRWRFVPHDTLHTYVGAAGSLIPPFEYHTIANARPDEPSITIHVYGRELHHCSIFENDEDGWYQRQTKPLWYSN